MGLAIGEDTRSIAGEDGYAGHMSQRTQQQIETLRMAVSTARSRSEAIEYGRRLARRYPRHPEIQFLLGTALFNAGLYDESEKAFLKAVAVDNGHIGARFNLAMILRMKGDHDGALAQLQQAHVRDSTQVQVVGALAELFVVRSQYDKALDVLRPWLESNQDIEPPVAVAAANYYLKKGEFENGIAVIDRMVAGDSGQFQDDVIEMSFLRGQMLEGLERYDEAFEVYDEANRANTCYFDRTHFEKQVSQVTRRWNRANYEQLSLIKREPWPSQLPTPVFVVGIPRSGTSLVEQMLQCHPEILGGGEMITIPSFVHARIDQMDHCGVDLILDPRAFELDDLITGRRMLIKSIEDTLSASDTDASAVRFVADKMPTNFLHLGVIFALCPDAKVVWCQRDCRDIAISCYSMRFAGGGHPWCYSLENLGTFVNAHDNLRDHWKALFPDSIHEVTYEHLVENTESEIRDMTTSLELEYSEACLDFHLSDRIVQTASSHQVSRPIYHSSIGRWQRFKQHLGPFIQAVNSELNPESSTNV